MGRIFDGGHIYGNNYFRKYAPPPHFSKKITVNMPPLTKTAVSVGGGIFTVEMLTFSGKSAEKVMGVNGFDCPAIFLGAGALNF